MNNYSIAIDGPAGAGKSTIAKLIARQLHAIYIDTGAMYRAMGLYLSENEVNLEDEGAVKKACDSVSITIGFSNGEQQVFLNGENVNGRIRSVEASKMASACSQKGAVREKLVLLQQQMAEKEDVVMDGRDIGTKVLPNADLKIYLTADARVRAKRRYDEMKAKGEQCDLDEITKSIIERDHQDMTREISPLCQAEDAILVDSSNLSISEVAEYIISLKNKKEIEKCQHES